MRAKHRSAAVGKTAAASESVMLGGIDASEDSPDLVHLQSRWLERRFGLAPQRASLVAELAMAGAA